MISRMGTQIVNKERLCWIVAGSIATILVGLLSYAAYLKYLSFAYRDWDLAIYAQFCHNAWHGRFNSALLGTAFFGNHFNLLMLAVVPLYVVFSSPVCLLVLQATMLAAAALPLYAIGRRVLGPTAGLVPVVIYALNPAMHFAALNEFHPETFLPFLFLAAVNSIMTGSTAGFLVWSGLCLLLKENVALLILALGLYAAVVYRRRAGGAVAGVAAIYFLVVVLFVIPPLNRNVVGYYNVYPHFGRTPGEILAGIALHPWLALTVLLTPEKMTYLSWLLAPLLLLPLLGPAAALMAIPLTLQHLLSSRPAEYSREYYYSMEILPPLLVATVFGLRRVLGWIPAPHHGGVLPAICAAGIVASVWLGPFAPGRHRDNTRNFVMDYRDLEKQRWVNRIPADEPGVATFEFLPHLANRPRLYSFHYAYAGHSILSASGGELPMDLSWALIDFNDNLTFRAHYQPDGYRRISEFLATRRLHPVDFEEAMVLFVRDAEPTEILWERLESAPPDADPSAGWPMRVGDDIELLACESRETARSELMELTLYWKCARASRQDLLLELDLLDANGRLFNAKSHPVGYRMWPVLSWTPGAIYRERLRIIVPPAASKFSWQFRAGFKDMASGRRLPVEPACPELMDSEGRVALPVRPPTTR